MNNIKTGWVLAILLGILVAACSPIEVTSPADNTTSPVVNETAGGFSSIDYQSEEDTISTPPVVVEEPTEEVQTSMPTKTVKEGELVSLRTNAAVDPDGDALEYTFPEQFDANGQWQTEIGDAGEYIFAIVVTDGDFTSELEVKVIVESVNAKPVIANFEDVTVQEGEVIVLNPDITDREEEDLEVKFSGFMTEAEYQTNFEDAGTYTVTLTVSDSVHTISEEITVTIQERNRKPILQPFADKVAQTGEVVIIEPLGTDPDGDDLVFEFSAPFEADGTFTTTADDVGEYEVTVTASDGNLDHEQTFNLIVRPENRAPTISIEQSLQALEGQVFELVPVTADEDGDEVFLTYDGYMTSSTKYIEYDQEGQHTVTITASDGQETTSLDVTIEVQNVNRPPQFVGDIFE